MFDFFKKMFVKGFLTDYKERLLTKTDYYKKFYNIVEGDNGINFDKTTLNEVFINNLSEGELEQIYSELKTEETYLN